MERAPPGARIILDLIQRAEAGDPLLGPKEEELYGAIAYYAHALWLTRFHDKVLGRDRRRDLLQHIGMFERDWPKEAIEISKEVGWPDDNFERPSSIVARTVGVDPF